MKIVPTALFLAFSIAGSVIAQDAPPKKIRFIPLGEQPVWKEELKNGVRVQIKPPKGAIPPAQIAVAGVGGEAKVLRLSLGMFTDDVLLSRNAENLSLFEGKELGSGAWLQSKRPAKSPTLGVLFRDNANMSWEKPAMVVLADDRAALGPGEIRVVNVSDRVAIIQLGKNAAVKIKPGSSEVMKLAKGGKTPMNVGYVPKGGGGKSIYKNDVRAGRNERVQAFFYKAQGKNPRDAVKFILKPETAPAQ